MQPQTAPLTHDFAKTLRYRREEITLPYAREPVDVDDTVPVALYSRPYERIDIAESTPYERVDIELEIEFETEDDAAATPIPATRDLYDHAYAPSRAFRLVRLLFGFSIACCTFAVGFGLAFLLR